MILRTVIFLLIANSVLAADCSVFYDHALGDNELSIAISYGYGDTVDEGTDWVADTISADALSGRLVRRCDGSLELCGFSRLTRYGEWPAKFMKEVDGHRVTVELMTSSYSISNRENESIHSQQQSDKTSRAQAFFLDSINRADVVFYSGHSRDGGGPSFKPPARYGGHSGVNYNWHRQHKVGLNTLVNHLQSTRERPLLFGMFSCASKAHFLKHLEPLMPTSGFVLSSRVIQEQSAKSALDVALTNIVNLRCIDRTQLTKHSFDVLPRSLNL